MNAIRTLLTNLRPAVAKEMQSLVDQLSRENPLWSAARIRDTLILLQYDPPCEDTIRKYMYRPGKPRKRSTAWLPFLCNHVDVSWAIDFFTVTTLNFAALYVFGVLDHGRRQVIHFAVTRHPLMNWVIRQLREATPFGPTTSRPQWGHTYLPNKASRNLRPKQTDLHSCTRRLASPVCPRSGVACRRGFSTRLNTTAGSPTCYVKKIPPIPSTPLAGVNKS
jgi:hypothetical protein